MILFIILFILIVAASAYLAYISMRDYYDLPEKIKNYSLFLIREPSALNVANLDKFLAESSAPILSFERLFKGSRSALVIYGPKQVLAKFPDFKLLELEDYTKDRKGRWYQFVAEADKDSFLVEKRFISFEQKPSVEMLSDYKKRKISPLGRETVKMSSTELLSAILLPQ